MKNTPTPSPIDQTFDMIQLLIKTISFPPRHLDLDLDLDLDLIPSSSRILIDRSTTQITTVPQTQTHNLSSPTPNRHHS
ncbi:hypothetical protein BELL_0784g00040 [Botrytis elliptica]|uniref:Uncharacterized protein n=1 Tax=Botrytis elliptica TaxID=278938 RepID=A0A4Z1J6K1_9HELO|nr:hypothetical protein BELL_0784g00040 [Botrytis elliptica]